MKTKQIPYYLRGKYQLLATVTFTMLFSLVFMLVSIPFSHNAWFALGTSKAFGYTVVFFFLSLIVVIASKRLLYATRRKPMDFFQYVTWDVAEVVVISVLYATLSLWGDRKGIISLDPDTRHFSVLMSSAFLYCFISLIIPYLISGMFFAIVDKNNTIRLMDSSDIVSDTPPDEKREEKVTLYDNNGSMKMSVSLSRLYYIESSDNYIIVWYHDSNEQLKRYMIRCRLKSVEASFLGSSLVRCHRKYIVNMDKVQSLRREKDGYELDLEDNAIPPIPITKTYSENVLSRFNSR